MIHSLRLNLFKQNQITVNVMIFSFLYLYLTSIKTMLLMAINFWPSLFLFQWRLKTVKVRGLMCTPVISFFMALQGVRGQHSSLKCSAL